MPELPPSPTTGSPPEPSRATVERVLAAAADVVFSDGVDPAFLHQWVDETCFVLSLTEPGRVTSSAPGPGRTAVYDSRLPPG